MVSDPSLVGPQLAAFVVPNKPVENVPLTEFQVSQCYLNISSVDFKITGGSLFHR